MSRRFDTRIPVAMALAALTGLSAAQAADATPRRVYRPAELATPANCTGTKVVVYASRGSSENTQQGNYNSGLGMELDPVWSAIEARYGTTASGRYRAKLVTNRGPAQSGLPNAGTDPLGPAGTTSDPGYPAVGGEFDLQTSADPSSIATYYAKSVKQGAAAGARDLAAIRANCPSAKILAIGMSEGAEVTRRAVAAVRPVPTRGTASAILFGDVTWGPNEPGMTYIDAAGDRQYHGLMRAANAGAFGAGVASNYQAVVGSTIPTIPAAWSPATVCDPFDLACQLEAPFANPWPHIRYGEDDSGTAADRAVSVLGA